MFLTDTHMFLTLPMFHWPQARCQLALGDSADGGYIGMLLLPVTVMTMITPANIYKLFEKGAFLIEMNHLPIIIFQGQPVRFRGKFLHF